MSNLSDFIRTGGAGGNPTKSGVVDPDNTFDSGSNYAAGDFYVNTANDTTWQAISVAPAAAQWERTSTEIEDGFSSSSISNLAIDPDGVDAEIWKVQNRV